MTTGSPRLEAVNRLRLIAIYQLGLFLVLAIASPILLLRKKARAGLSQKMGLIPRHIRERTADYRGCLWIHAVSVGEFNAVYPLLAKLKALYPDCPLVLSTTTATGQELALSKASDLALVIYFPFDLDPYIEPWMEALAPRAFAMAETEIWPGFIKKCHQRGIPVISINARISPKSFKSYHRLKFFFSRVMSMVTAIGAQSASEAGRFEQLGAARDRVRVTGNMKLDGLEPDSLEEIEKLARSTNVKQDDFVVVAGSTHEGEEEAVLNAVASLRRLAVSRQGKIKLIVAPRHPERFERVAKLIADAGYRPVRYSRGECFSGEEGEVYLLDGLGQLARHYSLATVAFVGGTLAPIGGHNLTEPCAYSVPVCCGPRVEKTRDTARALAEREALIMVADPKQLAEQLCRLYQDEELRLRTGSNGYRWLGENQGAVERTLSLITDIVELDNGKPAVPPAVQSVP